MDSWYSLILDRNLWFMAKLFQKLLKLLRVKSKLTITYHPQSDRTTKQFNQEIKVYILIFCSSNPETWHQSLGTMEFTHNNWQHSDRQWTFFELILGKSPVAIPISFKNTKFPLIEEWIESLQKYWEKALVAHELARRKLAERKENKFILFIKRQQVWLDSRNLKTNYHKKMSPQKKGFFKISEVLGPVTYCLKLPETWRIHNIFHAVLLMP